MHILSFYPNLKIKEICCEYSLFLHLLLMPVCLSLNNVKEPWSVKLIKSFHITYIENIYVSLHSVRSYLINTFKKQHNIMLCHVVHKGFSKQKC